MCYNYIESVIKTKVVNMKHKKNKLSLIILASVIVGYMIRSLIYRYDVYIEDIYKGTSGCYFVMKDSPDLEVDCETIGKCVAKKQIFRLKPHIFNGDKWYQALTECMEL